jgi:hypothetical protein
MISTRTIIAVLILIVLKDVRGATIANSVAPTNAVLFVKKLGSTRAVNGP